MDKNLNVKNVEIMCKPTCKTSCISYANLRVKIIPLQFKYGKLCFPTVLSSFFHLLIHDLSSLILNYIFHYYTTPTITTTYNT